MFRFLLQLTIFAFILGFPPLSSCASLPGNKITKRYCGAKDPDSTLLKHHRWLQENEPLDNDLWNASTLKQHRLNVMTRLQRHDDQSSQSQAQQNLSYHFSSLSPRQSTSSPFLYTIDTYIHIVADNVTAQPSNPNYVTDKQITAQFFYLQKAYTNASIGYRLAGITRTTNNSWANNSDDLSMKTALRQGTYSSLNIYYQSQLQAAPGTPGVPAGSTLLGYCTLPASGVSAGISPSEYVLDGCNVLSGTMPGGSINGYNLGGTTAHEVGHWNGLLHTFSGNTCSPTDFGDYVADTPQEAVSTNGCPSSKDSCPNSGSPPPGYVSGSSSSTTNNMTATAPQQYGPQGYSGTDPIHNFMDYGSDVCYQQFTPGQGARMLNIWQIYRQDR